MCHWTAVFRFQSTASSTLRTGIGLRTARTAGTLCSGMRSRIRSHCASVMRGTVQFYPCSARRAILGWVPAFGCHFSGLRRYSRCAPPGWWPLPRGSSGSVHLDRRSCRPLLAVYEAVSLRSLILAECACRRRYGIRSALPTPVPEKGPGLGVSQATDRSLRRAEASIDCPGLRNNKHAARDGPTGPAGGCRPSQHSRSEFAAPLQSLNRRSDRMRRTPQAGPRLLAYDFALVAQAGGLRWGIAMQISW
jgi:hypothetical protein